MADEHKMEAAALLERSSSERLASADLRGARIELKVEALVHAVLHLADVIDTRNTIGREF